MQQLAGYFDTFCGLLGLMLGFGFLIFVHELGHFLVAKWVGIKVTQFAIGFGHSMASWRQGMGFSRGSTEAEYEKLLAGGADPQSLGETEYRFNWLPLGGYVKMLGQDDMDPSATSDDPRSFNRKPVWARACVISAGVIMNLIFAVILFVVAFMVGVRFPAPVVGSVIPGSPAGQVVAQNHDPNQPTGLLPGDRIVRIDENPVHDFLDVRVNTALAEDGAPIKLIVQRQNEPDLLEFQITPEQSPGEKILWLGIIPASSLTIGHPENPDSFPLDLAEAGVEPGMTIVAVDRQPVRHHHEFTERISAARGVPVPVTFQADPSRGSKSVEVHLKARPGLEYSKEDHSGPHLLGMVPATTVGRVIHGSIAQAMDLRSGDVIARLDSVDWPDQRTTIESIRAVKNRAISITVLRDGKLQELEPKKPDRDGKLGFYLEPNQPILSKTLPASATSQIHLTSGSRIMTINGVQINDFAHMQRVLADAANEALSRPETEDANPDPFMTVDIGYELAIAGNPNETSSVTINRATAERLTQADWRAPLDGLFDPLEIEIVTNDPLQAVSLGLERTHMYIMQTYLTLARVSQGTVPVDGLRGPVGIADIGTQIATTKGWAWLIFFLGMISVNLVVINFLPIPIVDGGLMVFLMIEKVKGSPVNPKILAAANVVGLALIGSIFLFTLYHDIARLSLFAN